MGSVVGWWYFSYVGEVWCDWGGGSFAGVGGYTYRGAPIVQTMAKEVGNSIRQYR